LVEGGEEEEVVYEGESRFLLSAVFEHDERH
jgi:hypothetical protein